MSVYTGPSGAIGNYASDLRNNLQSAVNMGTNANAYAQQLASAQTAYNQQQQQLALQQQMSQAQSAMTQAMQNQAASGQGQYSPPGPNALPTGVSLAGPANAGHSAASGTGNNFESFMNAIASQESGDNYSAINRSTGAEGKYQIMPSNVAPWTKSALGYSETPQQFLHDPQAQEATARYELNNYYKQYGPAGGAVAWYAGPGTASNYVKNPGAYNAPQGGYPSISAYALSILQKMGLG